MNKHNVSSVEPSSMRGFLWFVYFYGMILGMNISYYKDQSTLWAVWCSVWSWIYVFGQAVVEDLL